MQPQAAVADCYNKTAQAYADKFISELDGKHLDRILLKSFASENKAGGRLIDLGCGPGQTTSFLFDNGVADILGVDLSPQMIAAAKNRNPHINFETADILNLPYADASFGSAVAFYAIVHFSYEQVLAAFKEIKRILLTGGEILFSFHIGTDAVHLENFLGHEVNIDFCFFETGKIVLLLEEACFSIVDVLEREPYRAVEHPSRRAYIWAKTHR